VHALAHIVVGLACEHEPEAADAERPEALTGAAPEPALDRAVEALIPIVIGDLAGQLGTDSPARVGDLVVEDDRGVFGDGVLCLVQDEVVQRIVRPVVAFPDVMPGS
jgi:hypothetical protein